MKEATYAMREWEAEGQRKYAEKASKAREHQALRVKAGEASATRRDLARASG